MAPADTLNKVRFWSSAAAGLTAYTGLVIGLNEIWYKQYERTSFQLFNDVGEWQDIDKVGHLYTAYVESNLAFQIANWTGLERKKSMWLAFGMGNLFQATIEVMDGFSKKWGFSIADIGFNAAGSGLFLGQELLWKEQRMVMKFSSWQKPYPTNLIRSTNNSSTSSASQRASDLYGDAFFAGLIKDYNAQTYWVSGNIYSFLKNENSKIPRWLNVAVGYGAENMFGGFENAWEEGNARYILDEDVFPRYRQYFLSLDIDFARIKTKSKFVNTMLKLLNMLKMPAPALEVNTLGKVKFHPIMF